VVLDIGLYIINIAEWNIHVVFGGELAKTLEFKPFFYKLGTYFSHGDKIA
jgi:hypothetical protein